MTIAWATSAITPRVAAISSHVDNRHLDRTLTDSSNATRPYPLGIPGQRPLMGPEGRPPPVKVDGSTARLRDAGDGRQPGLAH